MSKDDSRVAQTTLSDAGSVTRAERSHTDNYSAIKHVEPDEEPDTCPNGEEWCYHLEDGELTCFGCHEVSS